MSTTTTNYGLKKIELSDSPPDITVLNPNFDTIDTKLKEAIDKADSAFQSASNGKTDIAAVVGSPVTSGDTFSSIKTKIQTIKNSMATNLSAKGITAAASETLSSLASKISNILRGQGNVVESQVLQGATFANADGVLRNGSMPNYGGGVIGSTYEYVTEIIPHPLDPSGQARLSFKIPTAGYIDANTTEQINILGVLPQNIKAGVHVGHNNDASKQMVGTFTSDATANSGQILSGYTAYSNGNKLTGTIPVVNADYSDQKLASGLSMGAYSGDGQNYLYLGISPWTYYSGVNWIRYSAPNHKPENIRAGVTDLGVTGTLKVPIVTASDTIICTLNGFSSLTQTVKTSNAFTAINLSGTLRISMTLYPGQDGDGYYQGTVYAVIYRNDVQVGTIRSANATNTYAEDFACNIGDVFTVRAWTSADGVGWGCSVGTQIKGTITNSTVYTVS